MAKYRKNGSVLCALDERDRLARQGVGDVSSFQSAACPPLMKPMRPMPLTIVPS